MKWGSHHQQNKWINPHENVQKKMYNNRGHIFFLNPFERAKRLFLWEVQSVAPIFRPTTIFFFNSQTNLLSFVFLYFFENLDTSILLNQRELRLNYKWR